MRLRKKLWKTATIGGLCTFLLMVAGCSNDGGSSEEASGETAGGKPEISVSLYDRGSIPREEGSIDDNLWTQWINEESAVKVNYKTIPRWESVETFNTLFASGDAPDLVFEFDTGYRNQLYQQGQLMPIGGLIEEHSDTYKALMEKYPDLKTLGTKDDGKLYEVGRVSYLHSFQALFIRKDWLDNLNLEVPDTMEELLEVANAFTYEDPDGNGVDDTFGIALSGETAGAIGSLFQNVTWVINDEDQWVKDWERYEADLAFRKEAYDSGLADLDFLTDLNGEQALQDWVTGKVGIHAGRTVDTIDIDRFYSPLKRNVPEADVIPILPEGPFGRFSVGLPNPVQMTAVVNAQADNTEALVEYIDFMADPENAVNLRNGFEGEHYELDSEGCPEIIDGDKYTAEVSWNVDFHMLVSRAELGTCSDLANRLDEENPLEKEFIDIVHRNNELNLNNDYPFVTHGEHMPQIPNHLILISQNANDAIQNIYDQAIVSGEQYPVEQAVADAKKAWDEAGGEQLEEFYQTWYMENKDTAFLAEDMYKYIPDRQE
ncbi:extracellular solute-binding protein [Aureibacillus halotolerans]|uniref:Putative aldouronate transport system substrate-binding protein n=1 Tax=Aureibacillus halotolerans TaxID=1508390 RepID=A0A4R6U4E7_9BACI|nr:extracellular solute-binding protein [Aureibacillus halotolerans]TDQ40362.1 putative aldouronate transport system substrate-binding protein [Aureibacillus halotolerans]